jgi:EmrB/QacA subfamily drug resistance transporter
MSDTPTSPPTPPRQPEASFDPATPTDVAAVGAERAGLMTHREVVTVIAGLMVGLFLAALDQTIVSTALPTIVSDLGGLTEYSWTVTAYLLTATASTPLYGKLGDLYGRKRVFQAAIVIFMAGSLVSGVAQDMATLIAGRAIQGLGAGGLIALTLAIVGDIVSPRERGRYQGLFGAVFGISSVLGPLLGGFFTEQLSWRWVFWINVPLGLIALVTIQRTLHLPKTRVEHRVDYVGAALIVAGVSAILLVTVWGGQQYAWDSATIIGLGVLGVLMIVLFVLWELRVPEPLLPMRLFRNPVFTNTSIVSFLFGFTFFGAIIYLPFYLQVVRGYSPTESGLLLLPLVLGIFITSTGSGQAITRTGRYKIFPLVGMVVIPVALLWLSQIGVDTPLWNLSLRIFLLGLGLGLVIQTLVVAVQNAVDPRDLGVATSSNTFFRTMGGAIGTAVFGSVLTSTLTTELQDAFPGGLPGGVDPSQLQTDVSQIQSLPAAVQEPLLEAFTAAIDRVFLVGVPVILVALVLTLFLKELPLRETSGMQEAAAREPTM